jgi:septum formation protein
MTHPRSSAAMNLVLASASPRRRDLLAATGLAFEIEISPAEEIHDASMDPSALCELNARLKAEAVAMRRPTATVIGADTLVFIDQSPLGKPTDLEAARTMLRRLSGRTHHVCTGVCIVFPDGSNRVFHDLTEVRFQVLDDASIDDYLARIDPLDKAGGYAIQEHGECIIESIVGSRDNVIGLPVAPLLAALGQ